MLVRGQENITPVSCVVRRVIMREIVRTMKIGDKKWTMVVGHFGTVMIVERSLRKKTNTNHIQNVVILPEKSVRGHLQQKPCLRKVGEAHLIPSEFGSDKKN